MSNKLEIKQLYQIVKNKIETQEPGSYSYELVKKGVDKVTRKIGEESVEVIIASFLHEKENSAKNKEDLVNEICDLIYHTLVLMAKENIKVDDLEEVFNARNNKFK